jgi:hypothetical protein
MSNSLNAGSSLGSSSGATSFSAREFQHLVGFFYRGDTQKALSSSDALGKLMIIFQAIGINHSYYQLDESRVGHVSVNHLYSQDQIASLTTLLEQMLMKKRNEPLPPVPDKTSISFGTTPQDHHFGYRLTTLTQARITVGPQ